MNACFAVILCFVFLLVHSGCSGSTDNGASANAEQAVAAVPQFASAADALAEGNRLLDAGETKAAIEVLVQAATLDPDLAEAHFKLGIAYSLIESRDDSVTEPANIPVSETKGKKPTERKTNSQISFENAVRAYRKLLETTPDDDIARFNLGLAYNKLNEDKDAEKALREAVKLKPDDTQYQTELGAILIKLAQCAEAISPLKKAIDLDPTNGKAEDLLEDAEACRKRIDYVTLPKDDKKDAKDDTNANTNSTATNTESPTQTPKVKVPEPSPQPRKTPN